MPTGPSRPLHGTQIVARYTSSRITRITVMFQTRIERRRRFPIGLAGIGLLFLGLGAFVPLSARELAVPVEQLIAAELAMVGVEPVSGTPVVVLRAPESGAIVPIFIGAHEARAILMAQRGIEPPRPMTHDLAGTLIESMGGVLTRVVVDELRDGTYHGALEIEIAGREPILRIDSRPSDALALAVRTGAAILVAPAVLEAAREVPFEGLGNDPVVTAMGITVVEASDPLRRALGLPDNDGVVVSSSRGMAAISGLRPGALIVRINENAVDTPTAFLDQVGRLARGEAARIEFWQEGAQRTITIPSDVPATVPGRERRDRI